MTPEAAAEIAMCNECISHLLENVGPDHIIVKYRAALIKSQEQAEEIKRLEEDRAELATAQSYIKVLEAKKNQEGLMDACEALTKRMNKQRAALKKLGGMVRTRGKALVEERARRICHQPREDKVGHWPRYENVVVDEARAQLRAEGVIR